ncbi:MAG: class I SAM-dependent methyltransferase [Rhodocyclaceae bacterium]|nr:class I SAM-dependent methyltransferase [Rhodocyclaceae bacterium]
MPHSTSVSIALERNAALTRFVELLFDGYPQTMAVRLGSGQTVTMGAGKPDFTLVVQSPAVLSSLALFRNPLRLAEAYFCGEIDIEGDLYRALGLRKSLMAGIRTPQHWLSTLMALPRLPQEEKASDALSGGGNALRRLGHHDAKRRPAKAIAFHYDVSNDFYRTWLDEEMVYSCAYFTSDTDTLLDAQRNKLDHICRKLRLKQGEQMLDIGCGWGALAIWAARHYGVRVKAITLSQRQYEFATHRVAAEGLSELVCVEKRDYRDLNVTQEFDKVASVGMFEHVGLSNLGGYFSAVYRMLKPGGLFLNHGITHDEEGWRAQLSTRFINRYVFPGGELDTISNILREMERAQWEVWDVEGLRPHYAMTLRHWVSRLEQSHDEAVRYADESTYRIWRLYMAACALHFEEGDVGVYQVLLSKRGAAANVLPLTRRDLYVANNLKIQGVCT